MAATKNTPETTTVNQEPAGVKGSVGENMETIVSGDILWIKVDLSHRGKVSSTGKSTFVATTNGYQKIPGAPGVSINTMIIVPIGK